jgi:hypothetical protein
MGLSSAFDQTFMAQPGQPAFDIPHQLSWPGLTGPPSNRQIGR